MKNRLRLPLAALLLILAACSTVPFKTTELVPAPPRTQAQLAAGIWCSGKGVMMIRQSALFELRGKKIPLTGIMKLDSDAGTARLVGMNDLGVKLFDVSVDRVSSKANYVIPDLARYPGFTEEVAASVRRIFLAPLPSPGDRLTAKRDHYLISRTSADGRLTFTFGGAQTQLLEKSLQGKSRSWSVKYYEYQHGGELTFPAGVVLDDRRAGYRLTLWMESVDKSDE